MSNRTVDHNGWMEVGDNPIAKVGVFPYLGREIGAPNPDQIYYVYRSAEELQSQETIDSFKLIPFIDDHEMLGANATPAERKGIQGVVGERVYYDEPYLRGNIRVLSDSVRSIIDSKTKIELSPGYRCRYDFTPGVFNGTPYDVKQTNIRANHLALVREGRSGADVSVQDHSIITIDTAELINMNLEAILEAIAAMSDEDKARLRSALGAPAAATDQDNPDGEGLTDEQKAAAVETAAAAAATAAAATEAAAKATEAAETGDPAAAEEAAEAAAAAATTAEVAEEASTEAMDAMKKQIAKLEKQLAAQDTAALLQSISRRDKLADRVSHFVGTFDHAAMTEAQVAAYGIEKLGIKCAKGFESVALDAWMQGRKPESAQASTAMDARVDSRSVKSKLWGDK